jgi:hypothetical protein
MANVFDNKFIQSIFPDATEEQLSKLTAKHEAALAKYDTEIKGLRTQVEDANKQLEEANMQIDDFKSLDLNSIKAKADEWKAKFEKAQEESDAKIKAIRYETAVKECASGLKFSSNAAKKAFINDVLGSNLPYESDTIFGFDDFVERYRETDPDAFFTEKEQVQEEPDFKVLPVGAARSVAGKPQKYISEAERVFAAKGVSFENTLLG